MKQFDQKLDFIRVLSMCMVIVIHVSNYYCRAFSSISHTAYLISLCFNALARVAVPIFFMISGALILNKPYEEKKHNKRILKLFITLIIFTIAYYIWDTFCLHHPAKNILTLLFKPERKMLWFLYVIIGLYLSVPYVKLIVDHMDENLEKKFIIQWIIFNGLLYFLDYFIPSKPKYFVPIISGTYYLGYFVVGYLIMKYKEKIDYKKYNLFYILGIILGLCVIVGLSYTYSLSGGKYVDKFLSYRNLMMNIVSISIFLLIYANIEDKKYKIISFISPYSFGVYLVHGFVLNVVMKFNGYKAHSPLYMIPISSLCILLITLIGVYILKKIPIIKDYV